MTINWGLIKLDPAKICRTTGWYNNCGLNCLTHFMLDKLSKMDGQALNLFLMQNRQYNSLLDSFHTYYGLEKRYTWQDVLQLLNAYPVHTDKEAIFAPVLRQHLTKVVAIAKNEFWDTKASAAISDFLKTGSVADVAQSIYHSNKAYFNGLYQKFNLEMNAALAAPETSQEIALAKAALAHNNTSLINSKKAITKESISKFIAFKRRDKIENSYVPLAKAYWLDKGWKNFATYIAELTNAEQLSNDVLQLLCEHFNIGLYVFTNDSIKHASAHPELAAQSGGAQLSPDHEYPWKLKVYNSGGHWTFEAPENYNVALHNKYYPETFLPSFLEDDALSGKFKLYSGQTLKSTVIAKIQQDMTKLTPKITVPMVPVQKPQAAPTPLPVMPVIHKPVLGENKPRDSMMSELERKMQALAIRQKAEQPKQQLLKRALPTPKPQPQTSLPLPTPVLVQKPVQLKPKSPQPLQQQSGPKIIPTVLSAPPLEERPLPLPPFNERPLPLPPLPKRNQAPVVGETQDLLKRQQAILFRQQQEREALERKQQEQNDLAIAQRLQAEMEQEELARRLQEEERRRKQQIQSDYEYARSLGLQ